MIFSKRTRPSAPVSGLSVPMLTVDPTDGVTPSGSRTRTVRLAVASSGILTETVPAPAGMTPRTLPLSNVSGSTASRLNPPGGTPAKKYDPSGPVVTERRGWEAKASSRTSATAALGTGVLPKPPSTRPSTEPKEVSMIRTSRI